MKLLPSLLQWFFIPASLLAQPFGAIKGSLTDYETKFPIESAFVSLENTSFLTTSDSAGQFSLFRVPPGKYQLSVLGIGYRKEVREILIAADSSVILNFQLTDASAFTEEDARRDLARGVVRIWLNAWPIIPNGLTSLTESYGFKYEFTGCWPRSVDRYNKTIYDYLDSLHGGSNWQKKFKDAEALLYKDWMPDTTK